MMHFIERLRSCRAASRPASSSASAIRGNGSASPRRCSETGICRTSSSSTAPRAAPARRRWSSPTTSARRCRKALLLVHNTLVGLDLRDRIRIGCAGKVVSAFDIARMMALGADWCNAGARLHVRAGLHPGADLPHRQLPDRRGDAGPARQKALDVPTRPTRVHTSTRTRCAPRVADRSALAGDTGSIAGWWSVLLLFIGATAVFAQLQDVLNRIFRTDATRLPGLMAWLRKRVFSLGLVFALGFLLLVSMTVSTVLEVAFARVEWMLPLMASVASWCVYALGFALTYHYLPDRSVGWKRAVQGGAATALMFVLGRLAIGWYLAQANPGSAYGSMGTLVLALVWMYYAALSSSPRRRGSRGAANLRLFSAQVSAPPTLRSGLPPSRE
jgi:hypothetical protein